MDNLLERGVDEIIEKEHLKDRLAKGDKLRVKLGIDPTAPDLHLGHTVVLRKLRQFQDAGHTAVFIIGDFTARIGDPSGKNEARPPLSSEQIENNMSHYLAEAGKVIDINQAEVHYNSEWYKDKGPDFMMDLAGKFTVARMLERDDFQKRWQEGSEISLLEILYPILQGYDSFAIKADLELGGTDQKFNLLTGRKVQKRFGQPEQDILTVPLIEGLDGVKKMSKSLGNYVALSDSPQNMFGKIMSLPDSLMTKYYTFLTDMPETDINRLDQDLSNMELAGKSLKKWKEELAHEIVIMYYGQKEADRVREGFSKTFSEGQVPDDIPEYEIAGKNIIQASVLSGIASSNSDGKRLVEQKGIHVNGSAIDDWDYEVKSGDVIRRGHIFAKAK